MCMQTSIHIFEEFLDGLSTEDKAKVETFLRKNVPKRVVDAKENKPTLTESGTNSVLSGAPAIQLKL